MLSQVPELPVYSQLPLTLVSGKGSMVFDETGRAYLDMYGGHAVAVTGHCHPRVVEAITLQAASLLFYSNAVDIPVRRELCARLIELGPKNMRAVFLCNSGAEANENALTLARLTTGRRKIVSVSGGFHGRTLLTLSLSGIEKYRSLASSEDGPLFFNKQVLAFGDIAAAAKLIDESCAALIIEPVQGLAGCVAAEENYLQKLREICDHKGVMLVFDEVQCGAGRCGAFTVAQLRGVQPNLISLAKGLGGGFPVGAVLADQAAVDAVRPGDLGSTFGGGPLACAAALANCNALVEEGMIENAARLGIQLKLGLTGIPGVLKVNGEGLMLGIVLDRAAAAVRDELLRDHDIIAGVSAVPEVLRILPPLNLTTELADRFVSALQSVLKKGQS